MGLRIKGRFETCPLRMMKSEGAAGGRRTTFDKLQVTARAPSLYLSPAGLTGVGKMEL